MSPPPRDDPGPIEQWPSYTYWTATRERRAQHWYICFCLMMSSAQDWLTSVALKDSGNLNWAATASYYSTVHCGRLLCFVACGDFPMQHNKLRGLFVQQSTQTRQHAHSGNRNAQTAPVDTYQFDWLKKFIAGNYGGDERSAQEAGGAAIGQALRTLAPELSTELDRLCPRFAALGALRNDSNYESLLIAHEFKHFSVSEQFRRLSDRALVLAERAARLSRDVLLAYVERDRRLEAERPAFRAATVAYFELRLLRAIESKVSSSPAARAALQEFVYVPAIEALRCGADGSWDAIENHISMDLFNSKTSLMRAFENKVAALG
jgi:hypothetical protein